MTPSASAPATVRRRALPTRCCTRVLVAATVLSAFLVPCAHAADGQVDPGRAARRTDISRTETAGQLMTQDRPRRDLMEPGDSGLQPNETRVSRYSTLVGGPSEADENPLAVVAQVHLPRGVVRTVGDSVRYVLLRTGYRLVPTSSLDASVREIFELPLPDNHRVLGPYRVDEMLQTLMGKPYLLVVSASSRTVSYQPVIASSVAGPDATKPEIGASNYAPAPAPAAQVTSPAPTN